LKTKTAALQNGLPFFIFASVHARKVIPVKKLEGGFGRKGR
jgi:hypothetical protein